MTYLHHHDNKYNTNKPLHNKVALVYVMWHICNTKIVIHLF